MREERENKNYNLLSVHLTEMQFLYEQMHARMAVVSQMITLSMAFYVATLPAFISYKQSIIEHKYYWIYILALFPFFIIAMLIAREDNLMLSHDEYYIKRLRPAILELVGEDANRSKVLTFLGQMNDYKVGAVASFASVFRYAFPLIGIFSIGVAAWLTINDDFRNLIAIFAVVFEALIFYVQYQIYVKNKKIYESYE